MSKHAQNTHSFDRLATKSPRLEERTAEMILVQLSVTTEFGLGINQAIYTHDTHVYLCASRYTEST